LQPQDSLKWNETLAAARVLCFWGSGHLAGLWRVLGPETVARDWRGRGPVGGCGRGGPWGCGWPQSW
jgi:hypothetical protein